MSDQPPDGPLSGTVEALARVVLEHHLDELARRLAAEIQTDVAGYEGIPLDQLVASCQDNLRRSLQRFAGLLPADEDLLDAPSSTAVLRAQQGLPLDALLQSYRLGGRLLWQELLARAEERGVEPSVMLAASTTVWEVIDAHSAAAARAYGAEEALLQRRDQVRQDVVLDALLDGAGREAAFRERAAAVLGMPAAAPYVVVVATSTDPEARAHIAGELSVRGFLSHWRIRNGREIGLVALGDRTVRDLRAALQQRGHTPAALSPVIHGFADLESAVELAETALRTVRGPSDVVSFDERLPEALLVAQPATAEILRRELLGPLLALPAPERDALLATLRQVVVEGSTLEAAARALFCHRNTVMKRIERVHALTGHRPDDSRGHLLLHLALISHDVQAKDGQP